MSNQCRINDDVSQSCAKRLAESGRSYQAFDQSWANVSHNCPSTITSAPTSTELTLNNIRIPTLPNGRISNELQVCRIRVNHWARRLVPGRPDGLVRRSKLDYRAPLRFRPQSCRSIPRYIRPTRVQLRSNKPHGGGTTAEAYQLRPRLSQNLPSLGDSDLIWSYTWSHEVSNGAQSAEGMCRNWTTPCRNNVECLSDLWRNNVELSPRDGEVLPSLAEAGSIPTQI